MIVWVYMNLQLVTKFSKIFDIVNYKIIKCRVLQILS